MEKALNHAPWLAWAVLGGLGFAWSGEDLAAGNWGAGAVDAAVGLAYAALASRDYGKAKARSR